MSDIDEELIVGGPTEIVEKGRKAVQGQIDYSSELMERIEDCDDSRELPGLYDTLQRALIHAYHALDVSLVEEFRENMGVVRASVQKGIEEGHIIFKPADNMVLYGLPELFAGGLSLVDRIQAIENGGNNLPINPGAEYMQLGRTCECFANSVKPYSDRIGGEFHRMAKQILIGKLGSYTSVKGSHEAEGYYNVVDWFRTKGDKDCVLPLLKFAVASHIVARDRGWFFGVGGTDYAKRVAHAIGGIRRRQGEETGEILDSVLGDFDKVRIYSLSCGETGILDYMRASHGANGVYRQIARVERVIEQTKQI